MPGNRTGERVLRVRVDVHLDDAVADRLRDVGRGRTGTAVKHQRERLALRQIRQRACGDMLRIDAVQASVMRGVPDFLLDVVQQTRTQLHDARLVCAMHVAERERGHVAATLAQSQSLRDAHAVSRGGIQFFVDFRGMAVFLAADRADFDLQHRMCLHRLLQQLLGDVEVLFQRHGGAVPHVRLEGRLLAALDLLRLVREQRTHPFVQILLGAVVGVQCDGDVRIFRGHLMCECGERERADHAIVHALAGEIGRSAHRYLNDAVGFRVRESLQCGIEGLRAGHIDRWISVPPTACGIQHFGITFRSCDSHVTIMSRILRQPPCKGEYVVGAWSVMVGDDQCTDCSSRWMFRSRERGVGVRLFQWLDDLFA